MYMTGSYLRTANSFKEKDYFAQAEEEESAYDDEVSNEDRGMASWQPQTIAGSGVSIRSEASTLPFPDSGCGSIESDENLFAPNFDRSAPSQTKATFLRSKSNVERLTLQTREYLDQALEVTTAADSRWIDRETLQRVAIIHSVRHTGCLTLPLRCAVFAVFATCAYMHEDISNVYLIESGLRRKLGKGLAEVGSIGQVWSWLGETLIPTLFKQSDEYGAPLESKALWSRVLVYNQLQGPLVLEQYRSEKVRCNESAPLVHEMLHMSIGGDMLCYPLGSSSSAAFGRSPASGSASDRDVGLIGSISADEYPGYTGAPVTAEERLAFYMSAFAPDVAVGRRLEIMRPEYMRYFSLREGGADAFRAFMYANTNHSLILEHLRFLRDRGWLDSQSKQLSVTALLLNAEVGRPRLEHVKIVFAFSRGGGIFARITLDSLFLRMWYDPFSIVADLMFVLALVVLTFMEARKMGKACLKRKRELCKVLCKPWALVEWGIVGGGWCCVMGYALQEYMRTSLSDKFRDVIQAQIDDVPAERNRLGAGFLDDVGVMITFSGRFRLVVAVYVLALMLRTFAAFHAQPRLGVVTETLQSSIVEILHFLVVLLPTFFAYAISGNLIFGKRMEDFSTISSAFFTCFRMLIEGEYDWARLSEEWPWTASAWTWSFMVLLVCLMLNMALAIVLDVYMAIRRRAGRLETVGETLRRVWVRLRNWRIWVSSERIVSTVHKMDKQFASEALLKEMPDMCASQFQSLVEACISEAAYGGKDSLDWARTMQMMMAVHIGIDRVGEGVQRLRIQMSADSMQSKTAETVENCRFRLTKQDTGWLPELAGRMAVQNHDLLSLQWVLQQLRWQIEAMDAVYGPSGGPTVAEESWSPSPSQHS